MEKVDCEKLLEFITDKCYLLDAPNHGNIGDSLIFQGEIDFLENNNRKIIYSSCKKYFDDKKISTNDTILLSGGGSFGDLYLNHTIFRRHIIKNYIKNKIIIFPISGYYKNKQLLKEDIDIYSKHPNVIICARDNTTYNIAKNNFINNTIFLMKDMAFNLNNIPRKKTYTGKTLILKRKDKEFKYDENLKNIEHLYDVKDWPIMNKYIRKIICIINEIFHRLNLSSNHKYGIIPIYNHKRRIKIGIKLFNKYDTIISTRLHGMILGELLEKKVFILDNSNGKIMNYYNTWKNDLYNTSCFNIKEFNIKKDENEKS